MRRLAREWHEVYWPMLDCKQTYRNWLWRPTEIEFIKAEIQACENSTQVLSARLETLLAEKEREDFEGQVLDAAESVGTSAMPYSTLRALQEAVARELLKRGDEPEQEYEDAEG